MIPFWIWIMLCILVLFLVAIVIASSMENKKLSVEDYTVYSPKIPPSFDGFRIVFLTDLHCSEYGPENRELIEKIDVCNPDIILVGGDMVIGSEKKTMEVPLLLMKNLAEKYPVYYTDGNHEMKLMRYEEIYGLKYKEYMHELKEYGVFHMSNETVVLEQEGEYMSLTAFDLDKRFYKRFHIPELDPQEITASVGKAAKKMYQILLVHNPNYFESCADWGCDLLLCGHFHGGMVRLPGLGGVISPQFQLFPKYDAGEYHIGNSTMILSRGLGNHSIKLRLFNKPEISCIELRRQEKEQ